jgi:ribosomal protein L24
MGLKPLTVNKLQGYKLHLQGTVTNGKTELQGVFVKQLVKILSGLNWLRKGQTANIYGHNGDLSYVIKMGTLTRKVTVSCPRIIHHGVPSKKKGDNTVNVLYKIHRANVPYVKAYKNERTKRELTVSQLVLNCSAN